MTRERIITVGDVNIKVFYRCESKFGNCYKVYVGGFKKHKVFGKTILKPGVWNIDGYDIEDVVEYLRDVYRGKAPLDPSELGYCTKRVNAKWVEFRANDPYWDYD